MLLGTFLLITFSRLDNVNGCCSVLSINYITIVVYYTPINRIVSTWVNKGQQFVKRSWLTHHASIYLPTIYVFKFWHLTFRMQVFISLSWLILSKMDALMQTSNLFFVSAIYSLLILTSHYRWICFNSGVRCGSIWSRESRRCWPEYWHLLTPMPTLIFSVRWVIHGCTKCGLACWLTAMWQILNTGFHHCYYFVFHTIYIFCYWLDMNKDTLPTAILHTVAYCFSRLNMSGNNMKLFVNPSEICRRFND